jgi:hypothetical protein
MATAIGKFYAEKRAFLRGFKAYYQLNGKPNEAGIQAALWILLIMELPIVFGIC